MSAKFDFINCDRYRAACEQGATFEKSIVLKSPCTGAVKILTGYTSTMQVRLTAASTSIIAAPAVTITALEGKLTATLTATETGALLPGMYVYDWIITNTSTGEVTRELEGKFEVSARVTR
jgi:hypothetical protein